MSEDSKVIASITEQDKERFWAKVDKTADGCWLWKACKNHGGYGVFQLRHHFQVRANRFAWIITNGEIPDKLVACHQCDTPACCNPKHIFLDTNAGNTRDRHNKGRSAKGERSGRITMPHKTPRGEGHGLSKLTECKVREMRSLYASGEIGYIELGKRYGVTNQNARNAVIGKTWAHVK